MMVGILLSMIPCSNRTKLEFAIEGALSDLLLLPEPESTLHFLKYKSQKEEEVYLARTMHEKKKSIFIIM